MNNELGRGESFFRYCQATPFVRLVVVIIGGCWWWIMSTSPALFIYLPPLPSSEYRPFAIPYTKSASIPFTPFASHHPPPTDSYSFWWIRALVAAASATATAADFGFSLYLCPFVRSACYITHHGSIVRPLVLSSSSSTTPTACR